MSVKRSGKTSNNVKQSNYAWFRGLTSKLLPYGLGLFNNFLILNYMSCGFMINFFKNILQKMYEKNRQIKCINNKIEIHKKVEILRILLEERNGLWFIQNS